MQTQTMKIKNIPAILWGAKSDKVYIFIHGKMSDKTEAATFAQIAIAEKYQVLSFDLPEHGERQQEDYSCNVWNGIHDLQVISDYAQEQWQEISIFAISLGAYFSLLAYKNLSLKNCLFLSPILDMECLIKNMLQWCNWTEALLKEEKFLATPSGDILAWDYYCYVKTHPIERWSVPTAILYGSADNLTERYVLDKFAKKFNANVTILQEGEHYFQTKEQLEFLHKWLVHHI